MNLKRHFDCNQPLIIDVNKIIIYNHVLMYIVKKHWSGVIQKTGDRKQSWKILGKGLSTSKLGNRLVKFEDIKNEDTNTQNNVLSVLQNYTQKT